MKNANTANNLIHKNDYQTDESDIEENSTFDNYLSSGSIEGIKILYISSFMNYTFIQLKL